ncbi:MAG: TRAP transporter small permease [Betaproteobacteria bacterium]|nr:TRAP transporter small permease [Betaproteobacteria bacterium]NBY13438.1 TRAP transporter small permease [Betaproteobacteria bacterium]
MNLIERTISVMCQALLWISTVVIFAILVGNTILRYATGASLQWANEVPELLFPWLVMSGVVLAAQHGAHITTSFLMDKMSGAARRLWGVLGWLVVCVLYGTLTLATWRMLEIVHDEKSPILQIPGSVTYSCVMVGMALLAVLAVMSAWRAWVADPNTLMSTEPAPVHW